MPHRAASVLVALISFAAGSLSVPVAAEVRDGRLFDPGIAMAEPAEGTPVELDLMSDFVGDWDLELEIHRAGQEPLRSTGIARVTFMNRGHGLMERTRIADFDGQGHGMATLAFLAVDNNGVWSLSEGNSWTETITITTGGLDADARLVLHDALRPGGGNTLLLQRRTLEIVGEDGFTQKFEISNNLGSSWGLVAMRTYRRHQPDPEGSNPDFFPVRDDVGLPAPDRADEAHEFDFLLGEFDARHWLLTPTPQGVIRWPSNATAVYALDGHAILEFDWHDNDPQRPDAAVSILRLYNRSMRRWESLFLSNRFNTPLHFGGVREGDRIVLRPFDAQTGSSPLSQWIFHSAEEDSYRWKGMRSSDRGQTQHLTWGIEFQRKGTERPTATAPPAEVRAVSADGIEIFGDHYRPNEPASPTVVLFHQAGGDARGEYGDIARRLVAQGAEVFAWDARSGGDRFGQTNRTAAALDAPVEGYCEAYPDLVAGLEHAFLYGSGGPIYAVGSSYSAALVIRLAAEHGRRLAGVAAFSPASGRMGDCDVGTWLPRVEGTSVLAFRPERELENESVAEQGQLFAEHGVEVFVAPDSVHGASMLNPERSGDVEPTWERFLEFLGNPSAE